MGKEMCKDLQCQFFDTKMELNCAYSEDNSECIKQDNGIKPQLCDSLPDDKEIEFVASDESNGVDVDDLKSRPIWADGFIEGAKWMRSRIK